SPVEAGAPGPLAFDAPAAVEPTNGLMAATSARPAPTARRVRRFRGWCRWVDVLMVCLLVGGPAACRLWSHSRGSAGDRPCDGTRILRAGAHTARRCRAGRRASTPRRRSGRGAGMADPDKISQLRAVPIFATLHEDALWSLAESSSDFDAAAGQVLIQPNQPG